MPESERGCSPPALQSPPLVCLWSRPTGNIRQRGVSRYCAHSTSKLSNTLSSCIADCHVHVSNANIWLVNSGFFWVFCYVPSVKMCFFSYLIGRKVLKWLSGNRNVYSLFRLETVVRVVYRMHCSCDACLITQLSKYAYNSMYLVFQNS